MLAWGGPMLQTDSLSLGLVQRMWFNLFHTNRAYHHMSQCGWCITTENSCQFPKTGSSSENMYCVRRESFLFLRVTRTMLHQLH